MDKFFILSAFIILIHISAVGQNKTETEIRRLEQLEIKAVQQGDTTTLLQLWAKEFVVNNPYGEIVTLPQILGFIRAGKIDYSSTERIIEKITFTQNLAIAMGREIITPQKATENAGKKVTRRYTNIWIQEKGVWRLTARQATNILVN